MDSLNTLVGLITCRPLTQEESNKMTKAFTEIRDIVLFANKEKEKQVKAKADAEEPPPWHAYMSR